MENKAMYPGSFDPITNGHVDIIRRGLKIFDRILVAVLENPKKNPLLTTKERVALIRKIFKNQETVEVKSFHGLLVEFAGKNRTNTVIRGLRAISDFEYEFQMALTNRKLAPSIGTVFLVPHEKYTYLNSTIVREVARLGGDVTGFVPPSVRRRLIARVARGR
jgi:pantetheine-phosphate adenylyltransferase